MMNPVMFPPSHPVVQAITRFRADLRRNGFAFGCLFIGEQVHGGTNFGILFAEEMPLEFRKQMLEDCQKALDEARNL